jgi:hypothetical protein
VKECPSKHDGRMEGRHFPEKIGDSPTKTFNTSKGTKPAALGRQCRVCKLQGVLTPSGRNVETTFQCGDGCMHRGEPSALCVDPCFRIWHTQHLDGENTKPQPPGSPVEVHASCRFRQFPSIPVVRVVRVVRVVPPPFLHGDGRPRVVRPKSRAAPAAQQEPTSAS